MAGGGGGRGGVEATVANTGAKINSYNRCRRIGESLPFQSEVIPVLMKSSPPHVAFHRWMYRAHLPPIGCVCIEFLNMKSNSTGMLVVLRRRRNSGSVHGEGAVGAQVLTASGAAARSPLAVMECWVVIATGFMDGKRREFRSTEGSSPP
jgi:hypothetical protein